MLSNLLQKKRTRDLDVNEGSGLPICRARGSRTMRARFFSFILLLILSFPLQAQKPEELIRPEVWQYAQQLPGIWVDFSSESKPAKRAVQMIFFFEPNNHFDARLWQMMYGKDGIGKQVVSYWIPIAYLKGEERDSAGKVFSLLRSGKASDLAHNFDDFDFKKKSGAAEPQPGTPKVLEQRLKNSNELLLRLTEEIGGTPFFLYRDDRGRIVKHEAMATDDSLRDALNALGKAELGQYMQ